MGDKKQAENEKKFLEPAATRLEPFWEDVFRKVFRGKKRGDGLMVADDRLDKVEDEIRDQIREAKSQAKKEEFDRKGIDADLDASMWSLDLPSEKYNNLKEDVYDRTWEIATEKNPHLPKQMNAIYIANEIQTTERGSFVSIKNMFGFRFEEYIDTSTATAVHSVFLKLSKNPDFTPQKASEASTSRLAKAYGDTESKARTRAKLKRHIFKQGEL